jgi:hypothetical protein
MGGESQRGIGWATILAAGLEAALVLLWVGGFAAGEGPSSPHFYWYVELPLVFLVAPALVIVASRYLLKPTFSPDAGCLIGWALWVLLGINFAAFAGYAMLSGGGV